MVKQAICYLHCVSAMASSIGPPRERSIYEILGIEGHQIVDDETPVLANQYIVEVHLPASPFLALDENHIPMHAGAVTVESIIIGRTRGKVDGSRDLFVEKAVEHGLGDIGIHADGEFPNIPGPLISIQDSIQLAGVGRGCFHNLPVAEGELHVLKDSTIVYRSCIEMNNSVDRFSHGGSIYFSVWQIELAITGPRECP